MPMLVVNRRHDGQLPTDATPYPLSSVTSKDFDVSLSQILVGLNRLIPLAKEVKDMYEAKQLSDDEVFKPANIDIESINLYIENTLNIVSSSPDVGPETRAKVIEYLEDIRLELAEKTPKWKKLLVVW